MTEPRVLAIVRDYAGFHEALRARVDELNVSRTALDEITGLHNGYVAKLLAPVPIKAIGEQSLGPMLAALGLVIFVVEDLEALARISSRMEKRHYASVRMLAVGRHRKRRYPKLGSEWGRLMQSRQVLLMSVSDRKRRARRAAKIRWKKPRLVEIKLPKDLKQ